MFKMLLSHQDNIVIVNNRDTAEAILLTMLLQAHMAQVQFTTTYLIPTIPELGLT